MSINLMFIPMYQLFIIWAKGRLRLNPRLMLNTSGYTPYTTGYQTYGYTGYPYTTGYTYSPYFNNFYNRRVFKREAEAEPEADAQYLQYYNTFGYTPYTTTYGY